MELLGSGGERDGSEELFDESWRVECWWEGGSCCESSLRLLGLDGMGGEARYGEGEGEGEGKND